MKKFNQKGFGAVEGLLMLIIVGLVGGVGYYVWNLNAKSDKPVGPSNVNTSNTQRESHPDWTSYLFEEGKFTIKHPGTWKVADSIGDESGTLIYITSPQFKTKKSTGEEINARLRINLFSGPVFESDSRGEGSPWFGETGGPIKKITKLENDLNLIWGGYPDYIVPVVSNVADIKVGDKEYQEGFIRNDRNLDIKIAFDDLSSPKNGGSPGLNAEQWENLEEYSTAVEILNTIQFK